MAEDVQGFEEARHPVSPWCWTCGDFVKWPGYGQCSGCLTLGLKPQDTVTFRTVHYDTAVLHAVIRRKVAQWEQACPGWELVPDMQRYWEDSTHPSKYVDRETAIGRKLAWTRFRVVRAHPRGWRLWVPSPGFYVQVPLDVTLPPNPYVGMILAWNEWGWPQWMTREAWEASPWHPSRVAIVNVRREPMRVDEEEQTHE